MMRRAVQGTNISDFDAVRLSIASPSDIAENVNDETTSSEPNRSVDGTGNNACRVP